MIYIDSNKQAHNTPVEGYIATVEDYTWAYYSQPQNMDKWAIIDGVFMDITNTEAYKAKKAQEEQERIKQDFFNTSLGYVKRKVTMINGDVKDFLFDIKPTLSVGNPIITYNIDGTQNRGVLVTEEFITECDKQIYRDFYGVEPSV